MIDPSKYLSRPFWLALATTTLLFAVAFFLVTPRFLTNDDLWLLFIAKGVGISLHPDPRLVFNNPLLGHLLNVAFQLQPELNWYAIFLTAVLFATTTSFLFTLLRKGGGTRSIFLFAVGFIILDVHLVARLNYTIAACLAFLAGAFLLAITAHSTEPHERRNLLILGSMAILLSFLIRPETTLLFAFLTAPFLYMTLANKRDRRILVLLLAAAILSMSLLSWIDHLHYQSDPAWSSFKKNYHRLADLQVNQILSNNKDSTHALEQAGWTLNDYTLFRNWYFLDEDRYGPEAIQRLAPAFTRIQTQSLDTLTGILRYPTVNPALILSILLFLLATGRPRARLIANLLWALAGIFLLAAIARVPERLFLPIIAFGIQLGLWFEIDSRVDQTDKSPQKPLLPRIVLAATALLIPFSLHSHWTLGRNDHQAAAQLQDSIARLEPREDQLFVLWDSRFPYELWPAYDDFEKFRDFHILALAPLQRSPLQKELLKRFRIQNLFRDMIDRTDIFLICHPSDGVLYMRYLEEHFGLRAKAEKTFEGYSYKVYRIKSAANQRPRVHFPPK